MANTVSYGDGNSDVVSACCTVRGGSEEKQWPEPTLLSRRKLFLQLLSCSQTIHFLLYVHGTFHAAAPLLDLRVSESK